MPLPLRGGLPKPITMPLLPALLPGAWQKSAITPLPLRQYEPNATNRVYKQGGIGAAHRLAPDGRQNHNVTVQYGAVSQQELDRMFGAEAPLAENVRKQITEDPNGVRAVSYIGKDGKQLAAALGDVSSLDQNSAGKTVLMNTSTGVPAEAGSVSASMLLQDGELSPDGHSKNSVYPPDPRSC